jgi:hypothetical protein
MRFLDYYNALPAVRPGAYRQDQRHRREGSDRDPFATPQKRTLALRLVRQLEAHLGCELDLNDWPSVVKCLSRASEADWRAFRVEDFAVAAVPVPPKAPDPVSTTPTPSTADAPDVLPPAPAESKKKRSHKKARKTDDE